MALVSYPIMLTGDKDTIRGEANPHWEPGVESWGLAFDSKISH